MCGAAVHSVVLCHRASCIINVRFVMAQNKRKRVVVSIEDKLKALKRLDEGETIKSVAQDYGVGEVTVGDWKRNRTKIEQWCTKQACASTGRKSMKRSDHERVGEALFMWFTEQRAKGVPLSGPILHQKALSFSKQFPGTDHFSASAGWLDRWKKRYGVRQRNICGEKLAADEKTEKKKLIEENGYTSDEINNGEESDVSYKMHATSGHKRSKERITIMAGANVSSGRQKCPLMVIGKSANPKASSVDTDKEDEPSLAELMRQLKGEQVVTDDDVRQWIAPDDVEHESSNEVIVDATKRTEEMEDDCSEVVEHRISHHEGFAALEKALLYVEQQAEANPADLLLIKRWRDIAARKTRISMKQSQIDTHFMAIPHYLA